VAVATVAGCGGSGSVSLRFDVAEDPDLQPAGAATLTLIARVGDEEPRATTATIGDGTSIDLGDLPVESDIWLSAELRTTEGNLVGFGEAPGPIEVKATSRTEATIPVRRPFVYLAGSGARLVSLDASLPATGEYRGSVNTGGAPVVVADVAGADLAVISSGGALSYVSTSTHGASDLPGAQIAGDPRDAVATPDGQYLVIGHGTASQASVVTVATGEVRVAALGAAADRVAVTRGSDGGWWGVALLGRANNDTGCTPASLASFPLDDPETATVINTGLGVSDIAGDARTGLVAVADRCGDRVLSFDPVAGALDNTTPLMSIAAPTAVASSNRRVWAVGHDRLTSTSPDVPDGVVDAWLVLGSVDLQGGDATVEAMPGVVERVLATEVDYPDQDITQDLHANTAVGTDLVVMPGGEQLAITMSATMHGDQFVDIFGSTVIPELDITTQEYWLVDAASLTASQRVRMMCDLIVGTCDSGCIFRDWSCLPDIHDIPGAEFTPSGMAALFGAR
jgi:hypothetical protein